MNYAYQYFKLITHRREHALLKDVGIDEHHIIPKSEGGKNTPDNLINLTLREHYVAHLLLAKIYDDYKMYCAVQLMKTANGKALKKCSSRLYEKMRIHGLQLMSEYMKAHPTCLPGKHWWNNGVIQRYCKECPEGFKKGMIPGRNNNRTLSDETKHKISASHVGKTHSEEARRKISEGNKGRVSAMKGKHLTEETRKKLSDAHKGKKHSAEARRKMSDSTRTYTQYKVILKNGEIKVFDTVREAAAFLGCSRQNFYVSAKRGRKCKGMKVEVA